MFLVLWRRSNKGHCSPTQLRLVHTYPADYRGGDGNVTHSVAAPHPSEIFRYSGNSSLFQVLTVQRYPLGCLIETTLSNGNVLYSLRCWVTGDTMALGRSMHYQRNQ